MQNAFVDNPVYSAQFPMSPHNQGSTAELAHLVDNFGSLSHLKLKF